MKTVYDLRKEGFVVKVRHTRFEDRSKKRYDWNGGGLVGYAPATKGGNTVVALYNKDGIHLAQGTSVCSNKDNYSRKLGVKIALGRALKVLNNQIIETKKIQSVY